MSKTKELIIRNTFHCPDCMLIYNEEDTITIREVNGNIIHDCDNCLRAIELEIVEGKVAIK